MSDKIASLTGEIPFPELGEGAFLLFRTVDHAKLQQEWGDEWFVHAADRLGRYDIPFMLSTLRNGLKLRNAEGKAVAKGVSLEDVEMPIAEVCRRILDALFLSVHAKRYVEFMEDFMMKVAGAQEGKNPSPPSPEPSSAD